MEGHAPDFLRPTAEHVVSAQPKAQKRFSPGLRLLFFGGTLCAVAGFLFSAGVARTVPNDDNAGTPTIFSSLKRLVSASAGGLIGEDDDRINIALLGIGGAGHDGAELTDTIMLVSYQPSTKKVGIISVPRDLEVNIPNVGYRKINAVNALAENRSRGSGPQATVAMLESIFKQEIPYYVKVDFGGFADIIDAVGGVDVYVDRSFTDPLYPLDDGKGNTETLSFTAGLTHMDGATALKYARSRHGNNGEGTDFARAARQQKILMALKDKLMSGSSLLNPNKLSAIIDVAMKNVRTNVGPIEAARLARYAPDVSRDAIISHVIDNGSGLVYDAWTEGYVLKPYRRDWSDFAALAENTFQENSGGSAKASVSKAQDTLIASPVRIEMQNATTITGLAARVGNVLESSGVEIAAVGNAAQKGVTQTTIYDVSGGKNSAALLALRDFLNAAVVVDTPTALKGNILTPTVVSSNATPTRVSDKPVDFIIVLGDDAARVLPN